MIVPYLIPRYIRKLPGMTLAKLDFFEAIYCCAIHGVPGEPVKISNATIMKLASIRSASTISECFEYFESHKILKRVFDEYGSRTAIELWHDIGQW